MVILLKNLHEFKVLLLIDIGYLLNFLQIFLLNICSLYFLNVIHLSQESCVVVLAFLYILVDLILVSGKFLTIQSISNSSGYNQGIWSLRFYGSGIGESGWFMDLWKIFSCAYLWKMDHCLIENDFIKLEIIAHFDGWKLVSS